MKKTILRNYAKLIAVKGLNVQKGQEVIIGADLDQPEFIKYVVEECYKAGAKKVRVEWDYQPLTKAHVKYQKQETLSKVEDWEIEKLKHNAEINPCQLWILSEDPDGLSGVNQSKMAKARQDKYPIVKPYKDALENKQQWCIAAVPGADWAKKVFPGERKSKAVEKMWEAILTASRAMDDPIAAWEAHNKNLAERCAYLNKLGLTSLEYKSKNGTDFKVGLIEDALFMGGKETSTEGIDFNPNMPSEEIFISPKAGVAEGVVHASMPLSYQGQLIEDFWIRFENGKAVEAHAKRNELLLNEMIKMDEGAAMLGECALIPVDSPISNLGIMFYNTLFDENASCHLALGHGFSNCLKDFEKYSLEECREKGINDSMIHVDFMIGTADMDIVGVTRDGKRVQIFKNGNWAF